MTTAQDRSETPPTKAEILEKYRSVIEVEDFEVLCAEEVQSAEEMGHESADWTYLGTLGEWFVWLKKSVGQVAVVVMMLDGFIGGVEKIIKYGTPAYETARAYVQDNTADSDRRSAYVVFDPPPEWPLEPDRSFILKTRASSGDPTNDIFVAEIAPGSGVAPLTATSFM